MSANQGSVKGCVGSGKRKSYATQLLHELVPVLSTQHSNHLHSLNEQVGQATVPHNLVQQPGLSLLQMKESFNYSVLSASTLELVLGLNLRQSMTVRKSLIKSELKKHLPESTCLKRVPALVTLVLGIQWYLSARILSGVNPELVQRNQVPLGLSGHWVLTQVKHTIKVHTIEKQGWL